ARRAPPRRPRRRRRSRSGSGTGTRSVPRGRASSRALLRYSLEHSITDGTGRREPLGRVIEEELVEPGLAVTLGERGEGLDRRERRLGDPAVAIEEGPHDRPMRRRVEDGQLGRRRVKALV